MCQIQSIDRTRSIHVQRDRGFQAGRPAHAVTSIDSQGAATVNLIIFVGFPGKFYDKKVKLTQTVIAQPTTLSIIPPLFLKLIRQRFPRAKFYSF